MTQYDPNIIYKFSARLYGRAQALTVVHTMIGGLIGGLLGKAYSVYSAMVASPSTTILNSIGIGQPIQPSLPTTNWTLIGILIVGLIGFWIGWNKAFVLKLQAQTSLCQAKIEENTRNRS